MILPQLINLESIYDSSMSMIRQPGRASVLTQNQTTSVPVKLWGISNNDRLLIDAIEFMNAIYEDMTQINEIISIKMI